MGSPGGPGIQVWPPGGGNPACAHLEPVVRYDDVGDTVVRRTDPGADGPVGLFGHRRPDIIAHRLGRWQPLNPAADLYTGCWDPAGGFVRLDVAYWNVVNPPGLLGLFGLQYEPYRYGPHPVTGFLEIDMDMNVNSGGEVQVPQSMYLGNIARFGGMPPTPRFANRVARIGFDLDPFIHTPPLVERSGEEFHLALFGDLVTQIIKVSGDGDDVFEAGETWIVRGQLLHRAHGYEFFSSAGGNGMYWPIVDLRYEHLVDPNVTQVTLVYPLTNAASAQQHGQVPQPMDGNAFNQNSVLEALTDLRDSVLAIPPFDPLRNHPAFPLIQPWEIQNPSVGLGVNHWRINMTASMSYIHPDIQGAIFAWTDAWPAPIPGDFDGDGAVTLQDVAALDHFIAIYDGVFPFDADNLVDGRVTLLDFGLNFSIFDVDYSGVIEARDRQALPVLGDLDADFDIDSDDLSLFVLALVDPEQLASAGCGSSRATGACCVGFPGMPVVCVILSRPECAGLGGVYQGDGVLCDDPNIGCPMAPTPVACCLPDGTCLNLPEIDCMMIGGISQGPSSSCNSINCGPGGLTGACCIDLAGVLRCVQLTQLDCLLQGGAYFGAGTSCANPAIPCATPPPGASACCLPDGSCLDMTATACLVAGGAPQGPMSTCSTTSCAALDPVGACCGGVPAVPGACRLLTELDCVVSGGTFLGGGTRCGDPGVPCNSPPPMTAACCLPNGSCVDLTPTDCSLLGGDPGAPFSSCRANVLAALMPRVDFDGNGRLDARDIPGFISAMLGAP